MTITDSYSERSYLAGLTSNMDVRAHIGRSNPSPIVASSGQEWQYDISTVYLILADQLAYPTPPVVTSSSQHGVMTFLLLEFILADQLPDLLPQYRHLVQWQFMDVYYVRCHLADHCGILVEKVGICFYFLIISIVISQLAYCRVSHADSDISGIPPPKWQLQIPTLRAHI